MPHAVSANTVCEYTQRYHENYGGPDPNLEEISWEEWFRAFQENGLALSTKPMSAIPSTSW
jgi:hypothetical protein